MTPRSAFSLSWLMTRRDWRAGELRLLLAALVIAVAAIASVGLFVDRMHQALDLQARQLIGADLIIAGDEPITPILAEQARARGLQVAGTVNFPSMVIAGEQARLASIKAATPNYPLRGAVRTAPGPGEPDAPATDGVASGTVWVDPQLLPALGLKVGDPISLGEITLRIDRIITLEPDRGANFVNLAPRVMIAEADLAATGLIQPASRVGWRLLVAGEGPQVAAFETWAGEHLGRGERIETIDRGRPELRSTLDRAQSFLGLVSMLTALIAAVAIALAAVRFAARHIDGCAVIRAIGVTQGRLSGALMFELLWLGLAGGLLGVLLGYGIQAALANVMAPLVGVPLPAPGLAPAAQAIVAGLVLLLGFGAWPLLRLASVSPLRVLRRDLGVAPGGAWVALLLGVGAFALLLWWTAGDRRLALIALLGFAGGTLMFALAAGLAVAAIGPLRRRLGTRVGPALRLALASWSRRRGAAVAQTVAVAVGLMALTLLTATRTDLLESWRQASPADAPNRIMINVQDDQRAAVRDRLAASGVTRPELWPMIRGRLVLINGEAVKAEDYAGDRARRLVEREFNLSYGSEQPAHNQTVAGRWIDPEAIEVSGEQGIMDTLGLKVGDELGFDIAGDIARVRLVGARKVDWDSMQVNFFMILSPAAARDRPQSWITSYRQADGAAGQAADANLVRDFPNLTIFDTSLIIRQVQAMLDQVVRAVEFLFVLTLLAGLTVLYAALAGSRDDRVREAGLMRALGASRQQLLSSQRWELGLAGGLAGLLAALAALAIGWVLAEQIFNFPYRPRWSMVVLGVFAGSIVAMVTGWLGLRGVLRTAPIRTLRDQ